MHTQPLGSLPGGCGPANRQPVPALNTKMLDAYPGRVVPWYDRTTRCFIICSGWMVEALPIYVERRSKLVRKARIGTYLWSKGQSLESFRKAVRSSPATTKLILFPFFCPVDLFFFGRFFCSCQSLSFLSFGDHHFPSSCLAHRLPPCTKLETHLPHIPTHPPCTSLVRVAPCLPPQNPSLHPVSFFCSLQALQLVL
jgi:hypothetical protein